MPTPFNRRGGPASGVLLAVLVAACACAPEPSPLPQEGNPPDVARTPIEPEAVAAEDRQPPPIAWGEESDGLRLGLAMHVDPERGLTATVALRNDSTAPLRLADLDGQWPQWLRFEAPDSTTFVAGSGFFVCGDPGPVTELAPGATWQRAVHVGELEGRFLREIRDREPGDEWDYRDELPPGQWSVTVRYEPESTPEGAWRGTLTSCAVTVTTPTPRHGPR